MKIYKITLLILIPLAIAAVFFIAFTAVKITTNNTSDIKYSDTPLQGQEITHQKSNVFDTNPYNNVPIKQAQGSLGDWQDSKNIKQSEYVQPKIEAINADSSTNIQEIINTYEQATISTDINNTVSYTQETPEDSGIWDWVPQTILRDAEEVDIVETAAKKYINEYGTEVKRVVKTLGNQPEMLSRFMEGRGEAGNQNELLQLSKKYKDLGKELLYITAGSAASEDIKKRGYELGSAYMSVGLATSWLAEQETIDDKKMLEEIYAYNEQIDHFAREFVSFANIIGAYGIKFNKGEGGDIFMPPVQGGGTL